MNHQEASLLDKVNQGYSSLWKLLIMPNKVDYSLHNLGPQVRYFGSTLYKRHDYRVRNHQGFEMECSYFEPMKQDKAEASSFSTGLGNSDGWGQTESMNSDSMDQGSSQARHQNDSGPAGFKSVDAPPCLVYCHSQSGNRTEGLSLLDYCGSKSMSLLLFDFAGCGLSRGEYVSLGWFENIDLEIVISDARSRFLVDTVSLWGRSMGAVTCILYAERHQSEITSMVLDSPFSNLRNMLIQIGQSKVRMPSVIISLALSMISSTITEKLGVNILDLEPGKIAENCNIPAVFIVAKDDEILPPKSVLDIYSRYGCPKKAIIHSQEGGHSSEREEHIIEQAFSILADELVKKYYQDSMKRSTIMEQSQKTTGGRIDDPFLRSTKENTTLRHLGGKSNHRILKSQNQRNGLNDLAQYVPGLAPQECLDNKENIHQYYQAQNPWDSPIQQTFREAFPQKQVEGSKQLLKEYDLGGLYSRRQSSTNMFPGSFSSHPSSRTSYLPQQVQAGPQGDSRLAPITPQKIVMPRFEHQPLGTVCQNLDNSMYRDHGQYLPSHPREIRKSVLNCGLSDSQNSAQSFYNSQIQESGLNDSRFGLSSGKSRIRRLGSRVFDASKNNQQLSSVRMASPGRLLNLGDYSPAYYN